MAGKKGTWASLVSEDRVGEITLFFEGVIERSFDTHKMNKITRAEVTRRFEMCASIFEKLRGDLAWGIERIKAHLPAYFDAEMNGSTWTPDERTFWLPTDGPPPVAMVRDGEALEADDGDQRIMMPGDPGFN